MPMPQAQLPRYPVQVLTTAFHLQSTMETIGPVLDFLNDVGRPHLPFQDATVSPLTAGPMGQVSRSQIIVAKTDVVALYIDDATGRSSISLLRRVERGIIYLPGLVCRCELHMGADTRWQDMLGLMAGDFFGVTAVTAFPLITLPGPFPQQADMLIVNRRHVRMMHLDQP